MGTPPPYRGPVVPYQADAPGADDRFGRWPKRWMKFSSRFARTISVSSKHGPMRGMRSDITVMAKYVRTGQWHGALDKAITKIASICGPAPFDLLINVGANNGSTVLPFLRHGFAARAIAVEPEPDNAALLRHNLAANGLSEHVHVIQAAAGATPGRMRLEVSPSNKGDHRLAGEDAPPPGWSVVEIPVVRLDDALQGLLADADPARTLTWMDIQGAEPLAIAGGEELFAKTPTLLTEFNPHAMARLGSDREHVAQLYRRHWNRLSISALDGAWADADVSDISALWDNGAERDLLLWRC